MAERKEHPGTALSECESLFSVSSARESGQTQIAIFLLSTTEVLFVSRTIVCVSARARARVYVSRADPGLGQQSERIELKTDGSKFVLWNEGRALFLT